MADVVLGPIGKFLDRHEAKCTTDFRFGYAAEEILGEIIQSHIRQSLRCLKR